MASVVTLASVVTTIGDSVDASFERQLTHQLEPSVVSTASVFSLASVVSLVVVPVGESVDSSVVSTTILVLNIFKRQLPPQYCLGSPAHGRLHWDSYTEIAPKIVFPQ